MDPFDDFKMKPLTKGLGFHRKVSKVIAPEAAPREAAPTIEEPMRMPLLTTPLPRRNDMREIQRIDFSPPEPQKPPLQRPPPEVPRFPNLPPSLTGEKRSQLDFIDRSEPRQESHKPSRPHLTPISFSLKSAFLDTLVILTLSLLCLICVLLVTQVELLSIVPDLQTDLTTQLSLGLLFIAIFQIYSIVTRSFMRRTLGEWTFDLQMGNHLQQESTVYPLRVAFRSFLVMLTGFVLLPLLSILVRKDLAGALSGVRLYKQNF